ncbi:MAG: DUF819 family protein, partial [Bacteroidales bacterium]|nr:DUF819 family protein [Bacteroidales bacterium]
MLGVPDETFILLNSYDMVVSFCLLMFFLSVGIKWLRKLLPAKTTSSSDEATSTQMEQDSQETDWKGLLTKAGLKDGAALVGIAILMAAIAGALAIGANKLTPGDCFMTVFILAITTLGIAGSFVPYIKKKKFGETVAMYCIYIFCIVVASMADLSKLDISSGLNLLGYLTLVVFGSLILQVIFAKIFKIDADTMIVSSVAFICSPPFVPMIAAAMKNRSVIVAGLSIGIIGYAAGNYLGYLISLLLGLF